METYSPLQSMELTNRTSCVRDISDIPSLQYTESHLDVLLTLDVRCSIIFRISYCAIGYTYIIAKASPKLVFSLASMILSFHGRVAASPAAVDNG